MTPFAIALTRIFAYLLLAFALLFFGTAIYRTVGAVSGGDSLALALIESKAGKNYFYGLALLYFFAELRFGVLRRIGRGLTRGHLANAALVLFSLAAGLVLVELALRPFGVVFSAANQVVEATISDDGRRQVWAKSHPEIGYVPADRRGPFGEWLGPYKADKPAGVRRLMFIGDSIAELRFLEKAIEASLPDRAGLEFWNTGVSGYSTVQERLFFERFGRRAKPDHVILEFCLNDFDGTPVVFKDEKEGFVVLIPQMGRDEYNQWLFLNSTLYRFWLTLKKSLFIDPRGRPGRINDMRENLARFQAMAKEDGFRFSVVIYPTIEPPAEWTANDRTHYRAILEIVQSLGIEAYDLTPLLEASLARHPLKWARYAEQDKIHPSKAFAAEAAKFVLERGLLR